MDESIAQKCHDLDNKVRLVEEERDALVIENDELQDQILGLRRLVEEAEAAANAARSEGPSRDEVMRMTEEILRIDNTVSMLKDGYKTMNEKLQEIPIIRENVKAVSEETSCVKEDFLSLKNHLNIAAKIELQTNEKMYENRLHHLEKMLEEMRHREESFMHIAEETNILKDQVDSLRELSLTSLKCERSNFALQSFPSNLGTGKTIPLHEELFCNTDAERGFPRTISFDSPMSDGSEMSPLPSLPIVQQQQQHQPPLTIAFESRAAVDGIPVSSSSGPLKITGQVKLNVTSTPTATEASTGSIYVKDPISARMPKIVPASEDAQHEKEYKFNCCSDLMARLWATFFD